MAGVGPASLVTKRTLHLSPGNLHSRLAMLILSTEMESALKAPELNLRFDTMAELGLYAALTGSN